MPNFEPYTIRQILAHDQSGRAALPAFQASVIMTARSEMLPRAMLSELAVIE
jgi:hypothetical protein